MLIYLKLVQNLVYSNFTGYYRGCPLKNDNSALNFKTKNMKKTLLMYSFILFAAFGSFGQSNKEDIDLIQSAYGKNKKELIQAYMTIPESQKTAFWAEYDKYENERKAIGRERIALIEDYANNYATLDDKKAAELMSKKLKMQDAFTKLQKKYFGSMSKMIGGIQASKFFQLEDYLENNIRLMIQENIPFIDEIDKTKLKSTTQQ